MTMENEKGLLQEWFIKAFTTLLSLSRRIITTKIFQATIETF